MSDNHVYLGVYGCNAEFSFHLDDFDLAIILGILYKQILYIYLGLEFK